MQQGDKFTEVWQMMWVFAGTLIWYHTYTHTKTHITRRHTSHSGASTLTHPYKYIFIPTAISSQQLSLLHWMKNSLISKIYFPQCLSFSKTIHLQKPYLLIRCYKTRFFLWNTDNTDRNGVNKQNKHTHTHTYTQRKITLNRVG